MAIAVFLTGAAHKHHFKKLKPTVDTSFDQDCCVLHYFPEGEVNESLAETKHHEKAGSEAVNGLFMGELFNCRSVCRSEGFRDLDLIFETQTSDATSKRGARDQSCIECGSEAGPILSMLDWIL